MGESRGTIKGGGGGAIICPPYKIQNPSEPHNTPRNAPQIPFHNQTTEKMRKIYEIGRFWCILVFLFFFSCILVLERDLGCISGHILGFRGVLCFIWGIMITRGGGVFFIESSRRGGVLPGEGGKEVPGGCLQGIGGGGGAKLLFSGPKFPLRKYLTGTSLNFLTIQNLAKENSPRQSAGVAMLTLPFSLSVPNSLIQLCAGSHGAWMSGALDQDKAPIRKRQRSIKRELKKSAESQGPLIGDRGVKTCRTLEGGNSPRKFSLEGLDF